MTKIVLPPQAQEPPMKWLLVVLHMSPAGQSVRYDFPMPGVTACEDAAAEIRSQAAGGAVAFCVPLDAEGAQDEASR